jgi:hypothetical protein
MVVDVHGAEGLIDFLPIEIVEIRDIAFRTDRDALKNANQSCGIPVGQGLKQSGVDECKDSYTGAHSQGQHEDGGTGESQILSQLPQSESHILYHVFQKGMLRRSR